MYDNYSNIKEYRQRVIYKNLEINRKISKVLGLIKGLPRSIKYNMQAKLEKKIEASKIRIKNRCIITNKNRSVDRLYGLNRIIFKKKILDGSLIGMKKSLW